MDKGKKELIGFCSAPWTDCITYADGELKACDRNVASFGNWQQDGLKRTWHSEKFQEFRQAMAEGRYPDKDCASCHNNGTQRTAVSSLLGAFAVHQDFLESFLGRKHPEIDVVERLMWLKTRNHKSDRHLPIFFEYLNRLQRENPRAFTENQDFHLAIVKMRVLGEALEDYLHGVLLPRRVATFRQSQLQAKCTARCVMCAGKYTGEIVNGPTMGSEWVDEAFSSIEDVTDFWCNGAEYLFYKDWRKIALMLNEQGVKMRVSTNGILLNEDNIRFLIDHKILRFLTISLDGATKDTVETIRVNVNYERVMERLRYLFRYATEKNYYFEFTAAFVLMKRNLHELPSFVRMVHALRGENRQVQMTVLCQPLENFSVEAYRRYVHEQHHVQFGEEDARAIFREAHKAQQETDIQVSFYNQKLNEFIADGMPIPRFFARQMDVDMILANAESDTPAFQATEHLIVQEFEEWVKRARYHRPRLLELLADYFISRNFSDPVVTETMRVFPELRPALAAKLHTRLSRIVDRLELATMKVKPPVSVLTVRKYSLSPFRSGEFVYSTGAKTDGLVASVFGAHALLYGRQIVPAAGFLFRVVEKYGLDGNFVERPLVPPLTLRMAYLCALCDAYARLHRWKDRMLGGRKSLLLWKLSVAYRSALGFLGVKAHSAIQLDPAAGLELVAEKSGN